MDRPTAHFDWQDLHVPAPTITATNPDNGHAHLFYGLNIPVLTCLENPKVHKSPFRYAAAVNVAYTQKLGADRGYSGLISKNPLNDYWNVQTWQNEPYTLDWLADYVNLPRTYLDQRTRLEPIGLGRNCTLFEYVRLWAYREIRLSGYLSNDFFIYYCQQYAKERNAQFEYPLPNNEVNAIGKSVGKWVVRHFSPEGFKLWSDNRRNKSILVRQEKAKKRNAEILRYAFNNPNATYKEIADLFSISIDKLKHMRELRENRNSHVHINNRSYINAL